MTRPLTLVLSLAALAALGAACTAKTTVTSGNTNISATTTLNTSIGTNSSTTGTFSTTPTNSTTNSSVAAKTVTVKIGSGGVSPKSVTINRDDTVTFVNNDSASRQIASNPHPAHTDYSGFNSLSGIAPGQSYSFTFARNGTFGYHDHLDSLNSAVQGTIVVQ